MFELVGSQEILTEAVAQVHIDLIEAALAVAELLEVEIDILPLRVLLVGLVLEVVEEAALGLRPKPLTLGNVQTSLALLSLNRGFHFLLVEEIIALVDDALVATAAQCLGLLAHTVVVVLLTLRLRLGIDVDAKAFVAHNLHSALIPVARVVVQVKGQLLSAFYLPCAEGHGLANVAHIPYYILMNILGEAFLHGVKITSLFPDYQHYYA